ncbi:MAG: aromatic ring-hydroxylating dioxygenase subunit alpha [Burkholderiales bacterium]|nr:aromatic ring-hydroxylating dioxygenase subunit alpha [Burkholderiales bacterium]
MSKDSFTVFRGDTSRLRNIVPIAERMTPQFYEDEKTAIFRRAWLVAASALDLRKKGDFLVTDIPPLKMSLLVVRGNDDRIRVFHNVCRHRGDRLVHDASGCRRAFSCGFHAWTYANTGELTGVTDATQFPGLQKEHFGLLPVHSEVWENIVFVNLADQPRESLRDWLGPIYDQYRGFSAGRTKIADHRVVLNTNWNLAVNAFCEGYHNLYIHRNTVPDYQGGSANPHRHRAYIEVGEHFARYSAHGNPNHKATPAEQVLYGNSRPMFPSFIDIDIDKLPPGVNPSRFDQWAFDIVHLVPNVVLGPQANTHSLMWFWPIDHAHTDVRVQRFAFQTDRPGDRIAQAYSIVRGREVLREDLATMETSYTGISSGVLPHIVLSQQEMLIQNHYRAADDLLAEHGNRHVRTPAA